MKPEWKEPNTELPKMWKCILIIYKDGFETHPNITLGIYCGTWVNEVGKRKKIPKDKVTHWDYIPEMPWGYDPTLPIKH